MDATERSVLYKIIIFNIKCHVEVVVAVGVGVEVVVGGVEMSLGSLDRVTDLYGVLLFR